MKIACAAPLTFGSIYFFRVPARSVVVNAAQHRGGRRQGPRLPSRRREARHLPRLQDIQHPAQPGKQILIIQLNYKHDACPSIKVQSEPSSWLMRQ